MRQMGYQFSLMAFMKFLLQELEKIVIVSFKGNDPVVSGEFSLVSHIGAMVPRFIYSPIEEVSYNLFSKLSAEGQEEQKQYLQKIMKFLNLVGITMVTAGIPLSKAFLGSVYGNQWTTDSCVLALQIFCVYEWIMALNGISEAFVNANLNEKEMNWFRMCLLGQTFIYIVLSLVLVQYGPSGVILSNCLSMTVRICLSIYIIKQKMHRNSLKNTILYLINTLPNNFASIGFVSGLALFTMMEFEPTQQIMLELGRKLNYVFKVYFGFFFGLSLFWMKKDIKELYAQKGT